MTFLTPYTKRNLTQSNGLNEFEAQMSRLFSGWPERVHESVENWAPAVDLKEHEQDYELIADLPGLSRDDINLTVVGDIVTLKGERKYEEDKESKGFHRVERSYGSFQRSFRIPEGVDAGKVDAQFKDGVLRVKLPKPEESKPKQIEVKVQ